ncbi:ABC transporter ATP-binding protein [Caulifigura coniformis]|uniref:ABC transporter ATP-binding protein n=1 Tax=Caulifigura coniformis TaxID=2527983 RepID=UPI00119D8665|nr:ABC transporter ATP-binding protein [Caulifigura coniformis]
MSASPPVFELRNVSKRFGPQPVLRDVTLDVRRGETLVIIGESGCGKSVTLKLLMNLMKPDQGQVTWDGRPLTSLNDRVVTRERLRFGYLFQSAALFDSMNVFENVAFGLRQNTRMPEDQVRNIVRDRLKDVGLRADVVAEKMPAQLSGGMRKRVGLARALAMDPEVILYDEPTTGLDPIMSDVINELILQTRERRPVTSIVITHDMVTVQKVATRIVMFYPAARLRPDQPQIIFEGTADEAFDSEDSRVSQFVRGEAGERMQELAAA